jgi:hypothetical protein
MPPMSVTSAILIVAWFDAPPALTSTSATRVAAAPISSAKILDFT